MLRRPALHLLRTFVPPSYRSLVVVVVVTCVYMGFIDQSVCLGLDVLVVPCTCRCLNRERKIFGSERAGDLVQSFAIAGVPQDSPLNRQDSNDEPN